MEKAREYLDLIEKIKAEISKFLFGLEDAINDCLLGLFARAPYFVDDRVYYGQGPVLFESVPGTGKTQLANSFAAAIDAKFRRIQGVNDLLPRDITGAEIFDLKTNEFKEKFGPIFGHIVLIDEANRIPPKSKSAFLQPMEERSVTIGDVTHKLLAVAGETEKFFWVLATANPIEGEGVYPFSEAELDRFFIKVNIGYPDENSEKKISVSSIEGKRAEKIMDLAKVIEIAKFASGYVERNHLLKEYIVKILRASRPKSTRIDIVKEVVRAGASPRTDYHVEVAAITRAFLCGRSFILPDDVKHVARLVLPHKIHLNYKAESLKVAQADILDEILRKTEVP